jgi:hypothetical protein
VWIKEHQQQDHQLNDEEIKKQGLALANTHESLEGGQAESVKRSLAREFQAEESFVRFEVKQSSNGIHSI